MVPAREIIHDVGVALYHPLVGLSPIYASGLAAMQGLKIQENSTNFFANGSNPGGVLTAPGAISDATAARLKAYWDANFTGANVGKVAVLGDGLKFEPMVMKAVDAQLIEQLKYTAETVCSTYHVPPYMVGVGPAPTYNNIQALSTQVLHAVHPEPGRSARARARRGPRAGADLRQRLRHRVQHRRPAADGQLHDDGHHRKGIGAGVLKPNEGRQKLNLTPVKGGDTPYLQQQNYSLAALDRRDSQEPAPATDTPTPGLTDMDETDDETDDVLPDDEDVAKGFDVETCQAVAGHLLSREARV